MDKGQRDMQLLAVLASNDSARWQRQIARVEKEARDTAARLLTDSSTDDAITQAVSKAVDWLGTKRPFKVEHPAAYLSSVIRNSIRDYARTRKEEAMPDDEISPKLAWIDEGMGYFGQEQEKDSDTGTGGWHGIRVRVKQVAAVREYPEHPYLSLLCSLRGYDGWHTESAEINRFSDQRWAKRVRWTEQLEERALKKIRDRRWAKYKLTMSLINDIPGQREREIIKHYLWGYSVTESARKLYVSKPYVSKVVNRWMKAWGWDKRKRDETRILLLTHNIANIYSSLVKALLAKAEKEARGSFDGFTEELVKDLATGEISFWYDIPEDNVPQTEVDELLSNPAEVARLKGQYRKSLISLAQDSAMGKGSPESLALVQEFYARVKSSPQTTCYFSDLKESEMVTLRDVLIDCCCWWYGRHGLRLVNFPIPFSSI